MSNSSSLAAPPGLSYSDNPHGQVLAGIIGFFMAITTIILVLRVWSIWIQRRRIFPDDYFALVAWACSTSLSACIIWAIANGLGGYTYQLDAAQEVVQSKNVFASYFTWTFGTCFSKLAVLGLIIRVFPTKPIRIAAYVLEGFCVAYVIIFFPIFMTACTPPQAAWEDPSGHCRPFDKAEYASVSIAMALDLAVVVLPVVAMWRLQMRWPKKVGVIGLFSMGLFVIGIMAWRIEDTWQYQDGGGGDSTKHLWNVSLQSSLEIWFGFIASSLPTTAPAFNHVLLPSIAKFAGFLRRKGFGGLWNAIHDFSGFSGLRTGLKGTRHHAWKKEAELPEY